MWGHLGFAHKGYLYSSKTLGVSSLLLPLLLPWFRPRPLALSYPDRGHTSESTTLAPSHAFFTQQHADLNMPLLYLKPFKMTFPLPLNKNASTDHGHSIVCGLVLPCPTTSSHVTSALIHSIPGHIMLPSAPPSEHVLTLGSLEVVTITPHDPLPWVWNQLGRRYRVQTHKDQNFSSLPENVGLENKLGCATIIRSSWEPKFPYRNIRTGE